MDKKCSKCKKVKTINEFYKHKETKNKLLSQCKECLREYGKKYYKNNKEKLKQYYQANKERISKRKIKHKKKYPYGHWVRNTLYSHKIRGFIINIIIEELLQIAKNTKYCPICDIELNWKYGSKNCRVQDNSPTLDRINNEKILNLNNTQIICHRCNMAKGIISISEFIKYCTKISNKFN